MKGEDGYSKTYFWCHKSNVITYFLTYRSLHSATLLGRRYGRKSLLRSACRELYDLRCQVFGDALPVYLALDDRADFSREDNSSLLAANQNAKY
jgi:hypothetical protein